MSSRPHAPDAAPEPGVQPAVSAGTGEGATSGAEPPRWDAEPPSPRAVTLSLATVVTSLLVAVAALMPVPYAISSPGPTRDTLGEHDGDPLIVVDGADVHPSTGELLLTTVSVSGGPGYPVGLPMLVRGWLDGARAVRPAEEVFTPDESQEEVDARNQAAMISSQENATVAALEELGYDVPAVLTVAGAVPGTGADGVVREDDVVVALDGEPLSTLSVLLRRLQEVRPGTTVALGVERDAERYDLDVVTSEAPDGRTVLGVYIDPEFDLPVDVRIEIENIGGPSAGLMFALGIVDRLTPQDEAAGQVVAGTGTVDVTGEVGPIGGIRQKLYGAVRDGAGWFLAPAGNCGEVVGHVPDGLRVVRVETLSQARAAVEAIGAGDAEGLPTCG